MTFKRNLEIDQGADFELVATYEAGDPMPTPVDLTGCTARMQAREDYDSPSPLFTLTSAPGDGITLGGASGEITIFIPASMTETFRWDIALYDLELTYPSGRVVRLMKGSVSVSPEVTRA